MARATAAPVPVMTRRRGVGAEDCDRPSPARRPRRQPRRRRGKAKGKRVLGGAWGASFTGKERGRQPSVKGLPWERRFTHPGIHPYDELEWELRTAAISSETGKTVFEQKDVEVPKSWSQLATNVVVSKYFRGHVGTPERETSVRQLIDRVVNTIAAWAETQHYFATDEDLQGLPGRADPPPRPPEDGVQLAGLVQRRDRAEAAVLGLLHQLASRTTWARSWTSRRPRPCSSSSARAPAATSPPSGARRSACPAAGLQAGP